MLVPIAEDSKMPVFDAQRIKSDTFVSAVEYHDELPSTNDLALDLISASAPDTSTAPFETPLLILTQTQTAGRGRGLNQWWSTAGALTFSLVLDSRELRIPTDELPRVSLGVGVAICETLARLAPTHSVGLKWPNDVWLNDRKICGILVEMPEGMDGPMVIGIGININNSFTLAPDELKSTATSLFDTTGTTFDLNAVLIAVLAEIHLVLTELSDSTPLERVADQALHCRWQQYSVLTGRNLRLKVGDHIIAGTCRQIATDGGLVLDTLEGQQTLYGGIVLM